MSPGHSRSVLLAALAGAGLGIYALYEPRRFRLVTRDVEVGGRVPELSILHLSDFHMRAGSEPLQAFLARLPDQLATAPDLILATGDLIEDDGGIEPTVDALCSLEARLGRFYVLGSHDYYQSKFRFPPSYLSGPREPQRTRPADTARLETGLQDKGWVALTNRTEVVDVAEGTIRVAGVDDPFLDRHRTDHIGRVPTDVLAIGLTHAPDIVSEFLLAGFELVLAGHTHGGQLRLPFGAPVTNCSLPSALAGGLHRIGDGWLHVSPGLGTSRFAPVRLGSRPEATLLRLRP
ncbi:MAG: metallophosphoesterase [Actinomycetota bacterium]